MVRGNNVPIQPRMSYQLKNGKSPIDGLIDILENKETIMIMDCQAAIVIAQYYAIFLVLKDHLKEDIAKKVFDQIFNLNPGLLISCYCAEAGTSEGRTPLQLSDAIEQAVRINESNILIPVL